MRTVLISLAAAASALAVATPASAQWYPQPQPQPYGYGYGYGTPYGTPYGYQAPRYGYSYGTPYGYSPYGYQRPQYGYSYGSPYGYSSYGQAQAMKVRIDRIQREIRRLTQYRMISRSEYENRLRDSREIERRFYRNAIDGRGLSAAEMHDVQHRVAHLEQKLARDVRDGRQWGFRW